MSACSPFRSMTAGELTGRYSKQTRHTSHVQLQLQPARPAACSCTADTHTAIQAGVTKSNQRCCCWPAHGRSVDQCRRSGPAP
eukprot:5368609-Prymnesium_polylepis.1